MGSCLGSVIEEYSLLEFDTFPLLPNSKIPAVERWESAAPNRLWRNALANANIGIRCGGDAQLMVIDCDEKNVIGTFNNTVRYLGSLGHMPGEYPVVQTVSKIGRHIYVRFIGKLSGHYRKLSNDFGAGELRYGQGAFVVGVPSVVDDIPIRLLSGDFRELPKLDLRDILPLLKNQTLTNELEQKRPNIPRRTRALLEGKGIDRYQSRSEAEQAIITGLVNVGAEFDYVLHLFLNHPAADKFAELDQKNPQNATRWLRLSYQNAVKWSNQNESEGRKMARQAVNWAHSHSWPGRTGTTDRAVFLAHTEIAYKAAKIKYAAAARSLAELSGISHVTATKSTHRLIEKGYLALINNAIADCANVYQLCIDGKGLTLPHPKDVRKCKPFSTYDAFRWGGLGKSAAEVYEYLLVKPATVPEIVKFTGRHSKTVRSAIKRMQSLINASTGEIINIVEEVNGLWVAREDIDFDLIAEIVGTAGTAERQRRKHAIDRNRHRRSLAIGRAAKNDKTKGQS